MNAEQRNAHNLRVLQRHDPLIVAILDSTSHVVVYDFDETKQSWNKRGIEGTLFIVQRNAAIRHRMLILNRLSLDNFDVDLVDAIEFQVTGDYVIYRDPRMDRVQGLWIYEPQDRIRLAESLQEKCATSVAPPQVVPEHPQTGVNLIHLLLNNKNNDTNEQQVVETIAHTRQFYQPQQHLQRQVQPINANFPPIKHLQVLWSVLDTCLMPHHMPRSLTFEEFNARLGRLVQVFSQQ
ncbi:hypothetical protein BC830DRAFT_1092494 [Chytriomyces sp. MP71]|nr:hypothetical protein BC830DRAFT_1092494 [Chytriomyces sp. MP71]